MLVRLLCSLPGIATKPCKIPQSNIMKNNALFEKEFRKYFSNEVYFFSAKLSLENLIRNPLKERARKLFTGKKGTNWDEIKFSEWLATKAQSENKRPSVQIFETRSFGRNF